MAQTISLLGATYPDVPAVVLPKDGGGTASFTDVTDTTAAASDVASGKYFYTAAGVRTEGTSSGGGGDTNPVADEKDVNFIDFDGTIRYSYSAADFADLSSLPANPTHQGLTAQGWNWTLADAKAYVADYKTLVIGQMYITDDGATRIYFHLEKNRLSPYLSFGVNGTATITWGDGSATTTVTGTSTATYQYIMHTYPDAGDYVISISVSGSAQLAAPSGSSYAAPILTARGVSQPGVRDYVYLYAIEKIELGSNMALGYYGIRDLRGLKVLTIPQNTNFPAGSFAENSSLVSVTIPSNVTSIVGGAFKSNAQLQCVSLPKSVTTIKNYAFQYCYSLRRISFPPSITVFNSTLDYCYSIASVAIPSNVSSMTLRDVYGMSEVRLTPSTPPTVSSSSYFAIPADCVIYIPYSSLAAYFTATNYPSKATYTYLGFATYANGASLPTQDTTAAYNVTWYASKADAIAGTNPITQGNGNEIYCTYVAV